MFASIAIALSLSGLAPQAQEAQPAPAEVSESSGDQENTKKNEGKADPDAVKCRNLFVTNSRIPQRVCLSNFEWEDRARAQREARRSSRNRNSGCSEQGPC